MLPTVISIPDDMRIPQRLFRRGASERMKVRASRLWVKWAGRRNPLIKSQGSHGVTMLTSREVQAIHGKIAAMHGTHICGMCKHEKNFDIPHVKSSESVRIISLS